MYTPCRRSRWWRGLRRGSVAGRLLELWVQIPPGTWMSLSCECCVLSGRGLCEGPITRTEESYWVWYVWECSWSLDKRRSWSTRGIRAMERKTNYAMLRNGTKRKGSVARKQNKTSNAVYSVIRNILNNAISGQPFPGVPDKRLLSTMYKGWFDVKF